MEGKDRLNIFRFKARADRVDAHQLFGSAKGQVVQCSRDVPARFGFPVHRHTVFHVHADAIHVQGEGFFDLMPVIAGHVEQGTSSTHVGSSRVNYAMKLL